MRMHCRREQCRLGSRSCKHRVYSRLANQRHRARARVSASSAVAMVLWCPPSPHLSPLPPSREDVRPYFTSVASDESRKGRRPLMPERRGDAYTRIAGWVEAVRGWFLVTDSRILMNWKDKSMRWAAIAGGIGALITARAIRAFIGIITARTRAK